MILYYLWQRYFSIIIIFLLPCLLLFLSFKNRSRFRTINSPSSVSRFTETVVLLGLQGIIAIQITFQLDFRVVLDLLTDFPLSYLSGHLPRLLVVPLLCIISPVLAVCGRTSAGVILFLVNLYFSAHMVDYREINQSSPVTAKQRIITINLNGYEHISPDVWVNDVYLGKAPVTLSEEEWNELGNKVFDPHSGGDIQKAAYEREGPRKKTYCLWAGIEDQYLFQQYNWDHSEANIIGRHEDYGLPSSSHFIHIRYGSEEGYTNGWSRGDKGKGRLQNVYTYTIGVIFPELDKCWENLLDLARLHNYQPDTNWFETVETYGPYGWEKLKEAAQSEPGFTEILDIWVNRWYDLDTVTDPAAAERVFKRILDEVDSEGVYSTRGYSARALGRLVPYLDGEDLLEEGVRILHGGAFECPFRYWTEDGNIQFMIYTRENELPISTEQFRGVFSSLQVEKPSDVVYCHAIWLLDRYLDSIDETSDNCVEKTLAPFLIKKIRPGKDYKFLRVAAEIGGQTLYQYFIERPWSNVTGIGPRYETWQQSYKDDPSPFLIALSQFDGPEGESFRKNNPEYLLKMAEKLVEVDGFEWAFRSKWPLSLDFLFADLEKGTESMAYKFWPIYQNRKKKNGNDPIYDDWRYLLRMEPLSTVEMYLDSWRKAQDMDKMNKGILEVLKTLSDDKRRAILNALIPEMEKIHVPIRLEARKLRDILAPLDDEATEILQELKSPPKRPVYLPENIALWLGNTEPTHPLVALLAKDSDPKFRLLAMGALRTQPVPENVALLNTLLNDPDPSVVQAAKEVRSYLDNLASTSPLEFVSGPTTAAEKDPGIDKAPSKGHNLE